MNSLKKRITLTVSVLATCLATAGGAWALEPGKDGFYQTGSGVRQKTIAFIPIDVYSISHAIKELPAEKSKRAFIDADTDKRIVFTLKRDVDKQAIQDALRGGFQKNGYGNEGNIGRFVGAVKTDLTKGQSVTITYNAASKTTTISAQGSSASIGGVDFMKGVWSIWFGNIDQPKLSDALISKI